MKAARERFLPRFQLPSSSKVVQSLQIAWNLTVLLLVYVNWQIANKF